MPPINVKEVEIGSTWIMFSWKQVPTSNPISTQVLIVSSGNSEQNITVDHNVSSTNITELLPGTVYTLRIVVIAVDEQMSFPSVPISAMTLSAGIHMLHAYKKIVS